MNILMLVIKNTAPLDYALPLLWKIRQQHPHDNISVLYCTLSCKKILRESRLYTDILKQCKIRQYDFADFLPAPGSAFGWLWRRVCSKSNWDSSPWQRRLGWLPGGQLAARCLRSGLTRLENRLMQKVRTAQILPQLNPDIVLFDNTTKTRFTGRDNFYAYFASAQKKVFMLPHAPHHATLTAFTPFDDRGEKLPDYCEFWMPFKFARAWESLPEQQEQFAYVGYPGLDNEWLERFKPPAANRKDGPLRCLFVIRRFLPEGEARGEDTDTFIYDYAEFDSLLKLVSAAIKSSGADIELIVKPHPSNDFQTLQGVFAASGIPRWRIAQDSVYAALPVCDMVISLYSTILLITAMAGIPTLLLGSRIQTAVHREAVMRQMYGGLSFYLENPNELAARLPDVIKAAEARKQSGAAWQKDIDHLRCFYPDEAMQLCLNRLFKDGKG